MRFLKRLILGVLGLIVVLALFLMASIIVDDVIGRDRMSAITNTVIPGVSSAPDVYAFVAKPAGEGPFPTVIMIHEFYGLNESIIGKAKGLADEGYLVVAPDTFRGSTTSWIPRAIYQVIKTEPEQINQDLDSVFAWLESQPIVKADRIGVMGFCYGGRASLGYSLHNGRLAATVIFYGSPETDPDVLRSLPAPVLGIFGGADRSIPLDDVQAFEAALNQAGIPNEIAIYEGQPHAFVTDIESIRAGGVQGQAWEQMLNFLERNLKQGDALHNSAQPVAADFSFDWRYYLMLVFEHSIGANRHH